MNGYELDAPDDDIFGGFIEKMITGEITEQEFIDLVRPCIHELPGE